MEVNRKFFFSGQMSGKCDLEDLFKSFAQQMPLRGCELLQVNFLCLLTFINKHFLVSTMLKGPSWIAQNLQAWEIIISNNKRKIFSSSLRKKIILTWNWRKERFVRKFQNAKNVSLKSLKRGYIPSPFNVNFEWSL